MTNSRPSESGHWYDRAGKPVYQVPRADGKGTKSTTLREARQMQLVPGVTTIINCSSKPALETWKVKQGILAALTLTRKPGESDDDYLDRVLEDSREQASKAAERGSRIHASIQGHFEGKPPDPEHLVYVRAVTERLANEYGPLRWTAEQSFSHPLGYGSKRDLVGFQDSKNRYLVLDFKTKEFSAAPLGGGSQLAYDEHCMQGAANIAEWDGDADFANVFISVSKPGLIHIHQWDHEELQRGWYMFKHLLRYWQEKNRYQSGW